MRLRRSAALSGLIVFLLFMAGGAWAATQQPSQDTLGTTIKDFSQLNAGQKNLLLGSMGLPPMSSFTPAKIVAWIIFGGVGFIAFAYGKKERSFRPLIIGIVLMAYPYFFNGTLALYLVGFALCGLLYFWRE